MGDFGRGTCPRRPMTGGALSCRYGATGRSVFHFMPAAGDPEGAYPTCLTTITIRRARKAPATTKPSMILLQRDSRLMRTRPGTCRRPRRRPPSTTIPSSPRTSLNRRPRLRRGRSRPTTPSRRCRERRRRSRAPLRPLPRLRRLRSPRLRCRLLPLRLRASRASAVPRPCLRSRRRGCPRPRLPLRLHRHLLRLRRPRRDPRGYRRLHLRLSRRNRCLPSRFRRPAGGCRSAATPPRCLWRVPSPPRPR